MTKVISRILLPQQLEKVLSALAPMDFEERRKVIRWACDFYGIEPGHIPLPR